MPGGLRAACGGEHSDENPQCLAAHRTLLVDRMSVIVDPRRRARTRARPRIRLSPSVCALDLHAPHAGHGLDGGRDGGYADAKGNAHVEPDLDALFVVVEASIVVEIAELYPSPLESC